MPEDHLPSCFDPYLRYAISTDFSNFQFVDEKHKFFDEKNFKLFLFVELKQAELVAVFEQEMTDPHYVSEFGAEFGPNVGHTRYATLRCRKAAVTDSHALRLWREYVSRVRAVASGEADFHRQVDREGGYHRSLAGGQVSGRITLDRHAR